MSDADDNNDFDYAFEHFSLRQKLKFAACLSYFIYVLALCGWHWDAQTVVAERVGHLFVALCLMPNVTQSVALVAAQRLRARVRNLEHRVVALERARKLSDDARVPPEYGDAI